MQTINTTNPSKSFVNGIFDVYRSTPGQYERINVHNCINDINNFINLYYTTEEQVILQQRYGSWMNMLNAYVAELQRQGDPIQVYATAIRIQQEIEEMFNILFTNDLLRNMRDYVIRNTLTVASDDPTVCDFWELVMLIKFFTPAFTIIDRLQMQYTGIVLKSEDLIGLVSSILIQHLPLGWNLITTLILTHPSAIGYDRGISVLMLDQFPNASLNRLDYVNSLDVSAILSRWLTTSVPHVPLAV